MTFQDAIPAGSGQQVHTSVSGAPRRKKLECSCQLDPELRQARPATKGQQALARGASQRCELRGSASRKQAILPMQERLPGGVGTGGRDGGRESSRGSGHKREGRRKGELLHGDEKAVTQTLLTAAHTQITELLSLVGLWTSVPSPQSLPTGSSCFK